MAKLCLFYVNVRKKRKADGGASSAVSTKKAKQETEADKALQVGYLL